MSGRRPKNGLWNVCLFNEKPEDMRSIGALGGRARARNLRLRKGGPDARYCEAAEAIRRIDVLCPWLVGCGVAAGDRGRAAERAC
jgi:hypothetical protein